MKKSMLKIELLLKGGERKKFTEALQNLGVLHLVGSEHAANQPQDERWKKWLELKNWLDECEALDQKPQAPTGEESLFEKAWQLKKDWGRLQFLEKEIEAELAFFETWPDYNPEHWQALEEKGLSIALFAADDLRGLPAETYKLKPQQGLERAALIYRSNEKPVLSRDPLSIPERSPKDLILAQKELAQQQLEAEAELKYILEHRGELEDWARKEFDQWQFEQGLSLWQEAENQKLEGLEAWFEAERKAAVLKLVSQYPCAYRIVNPRKGESIPVSLKNNAYSRLFEPITKIFQLPNYHEFDLTPLIAVFYPILFAYCLGDAGYGAVMILAGLIALFTIFKKEKGLAYLVIILGLSTTLIGLIKSGSLFGIALVADHEIGWIAALSNLVIIPDDSSYFFNAFNVALLIGVLQILIGLVIAISKAWYFEGFKHSLSHWGKLFIVVSAVSLFMSDSLALSSDGAMFLKLLLGLGVLLVMLFHDLNLKLFSRIGGSILPLFFIFTGLLGDVLSYVRLFALGVTSAVLGLVVNQIGMDMMGSSVLSIIGASLFLVFGHSLNLVLAILGSFIHPLRLTFVEFYNNAQFEGGGIEFKPFQKSNRLNISSHGNS